jgi:hypothetical protein
MSSNIEKVRRVGKFAGLMTNPTAVVSFGNVDVSSAITFNGPMAVSGSVTGNEDVRGFTTIASGDSTVTISATSITSGGYVNLFAQSSAGLLIPSSIVDGVSFMAEAVDGATATPVNLTYLAML